MVSQTRQMPNHATSLVGEQKEGAGAFRLLLLGQSLHDFTQLL
jgi:hypothetical protein